MTFSYHAEVERGNRLSLLEEILGFTKIVLEVPFVEEENVWGAVSVSLRMKQLKECP